MRRREFITLLGGMALWPLGARAQQPLPLMVIFNSGTPSTQVKNLAALRNGLKEAGLVEGQNVAVEFVWAENRFDGLEALAAEVVARRPAVIVSNTLAAIRAKSSTTTIPIVFTTGSDPVRDGLVNSLNRPGGNVTGVVFISGTLGGKRLELLRQLSRRRARLPCWFILASPKPTLNVRRSKPRRKRLASRFALLRSATRLKSRWQLRRR